MFLSCRKAGWREEKEKAAKVGRSSGGAFAIFRSSDAWDARPDPHTTSVTEEELHLHHRQLELNRWCRRSCFCSPRRDLLSLARSRSRLRRLHDKAPGAPSLAAQVSIRCLEGRSTLEIIFSTNLCLRDLKLLDMSATLIPLSEPS